VSTSSPAAVGANPADDGDTLLQQHEPLAGGFPPGTEGRLLFWLAIAFSAFQVATAAHLLDLPSQIVRAVHVGFLLALAFPLLAAVGRSALPWRVLAWAASAAAAGAAAYQWIEYQPLLLRAGDPNDLDMAVGVALLALLFVATWRAMGAALPIIAGTFSLYCLFGQYLPSPLNHRGYDFSAR
jgi:TRAP-type uncharacterized transport system fused permease subunit